MINETLLSIEEPQIAPFLEETRMRLVEAPAEAPTTIASLAAWLRDWKREQSPKDWEATIQQCRSHALCSLVHQDPLTYRAFTKPRGYQGDAELLDIIYRRNWRGIYTSDVTPLGEAIFGYTVQCQAPSAVRFRRDILARIIDEVCEVHSTPHILSVACGHLREAGLSRGLRQGLIGRFVGLDQDTLSLEVVRRELSQHGVEPVCGSLKLLFSGALAHDKFDFIYAAGLYDYLDDRLSQRVTKRLFQMLHTGGRLLVANFVPDIEDGGFMDTYMDWKLIYRDESAMESLAVEIPEPAISRKRIYTDPSETIAFLDLEHA